MLCEVDLLVCRSNSLGVILSIQVVEWNNSSFAHAHPSFPSSQLACRGCFYFLSQNTLVALTKPVMKTVTTHN